MIRTLKTLTIVACWSLAMGVVAAHAQTAAAPSSNCGMETWSTDKMTYVTVPCASTSAQPQGQTAKAPARAAKTEDCGVETWSTDKMTYVSTPCVAGTTDVNPAGAQR